DAALGVDRAFGGGTVRFSDPDDFTILHGNVCSESRCPRTVDNAPVLYQEIIRHDFFSSLPAFADPEPSPQTLRCGSCDMLISLHKPRQQCYASMLSPATSLLQNRFPM